MLNKKAINKLEKIGLEIVDERNFELVDVEFVKEAGQWYLRYYIDKPGGITIDDCQNVSEAISQRLDILDPIPYSYILEVSSPGLERPLKKDKDFLRHIGANVQVKTFEDIDGQKVFEGILKSFSDNILTVSSDKEIKIPREKISSARLKIKWNGE